jgi:uncharacterized phage-associated protein
MSVYMEPLIDDLVHAWDEGGYIRLIHKDKLQNAYLVPLFHA